MEKYIYADNAATTCISDEVLEAMMPYLKNEYGNASSIYALGRRSGFAIEDARATVAKALGAEPREIFFTSGGSEADNWAIKSAAALGAKKEKKHIITTVFEHHAVLHTTESLEKQGYEVTYLPVSPLGYVTAEDVEKAIRPDTCLVSIMYANNEIGTIQPIKEIGAVCKKHGVLFHTDAVQAVGNVVIDVKDQNIDMLSLSGHKIHAQKGIGALYCRKGLRLDNLIHGGGQESGRRAGTENVAAIVGLSKAIELATENIPAKIEKVSKLRDKIINALLEVPVSRLNGGREPRLCGNINISFVGVEGEALLLMLDHNGIAASSGSACTTGDLDPSHVLLSLGMVHEVAHGSLRLSISENFTEEDADYIIKTVPQVVEKLRNISPLWEHMESGKVKINL